MHACNLSKNIEVVRVGAERQPVVVMDDFIDNPQWLLSYAESAPPFQSQPSDFYPGIRKPLPETYFRQWRGKVLDLLRDLFEIKSGIEGGIKSGIEGGWNGDMDICVDLCALSMVVTPVHKLRPIQSVPHFDTCDPNRFAIVHYLCRSDLGGTSFYRHRGTGYESIDAERIQHYAATLKKEVREELTAESAPKLRYINGDTNLFERTASFEAKFNRALLYHGNQLHSGNIQPGKGLSGDPRKGRLTANAFFLATLT